MAGQARFALQRPGPLPYTECFPQSSASSCQGWPVRGVGTLDQDPCTCAVVDLHVSAGTTCGSTLRLYAGLITHAKEKLVDQDALVSSLLAFDFESEGQSSGFGASDDLSDIWGAVGADKVRT